MNPFAKEKLFSSIIDNSRHDFALTVDNVGNTAPSPDRVLDHDFQIF